MYSQLTSLGLTNVTECVFDGEHQVCLSKCTKDYCNGPDPAIFEPRHKQICLRGCDQGRLKQACAAREARQRLEISDIETKDIVLSRQRTTKVLIRLRGCAGWSAPLLFAYGIWFSHDVAHLKRVMVCVLTYLLSVCYGSCLLSHFK